MSGIVGSKLNTRGSGLVAKLGTDGQILTSTGAGTQAAFEAAAGGGVVVQIVQTQKTDVTSFDTGSNATFTDMSGLSCAITPTKAGSKILIQVNLGVGANSNVPGGFLLTADIDGAGYNSLLTGDVDSSSTRAWSGGYYNSNKRTIRVVSGSYLWTPSYTLTDVLTVQPQISGGQGYINRSGNVGASASNFAGTSDVTLWEIN